MTKRIIFISALIIFLCLGLKFALSAQRYSGEDAHLPDFSDRFTRIETKLDMLSKNTGAENKEMARKLDQALSNQEKIFSELAIIKVRASKR